MKNDLRKEKDKAVKALREVMDIDAEPAEKLDSVRDLITMCEGFEEILEREAMKTKQEPKYKIKGSIINRQSGVPIPDDEPIFILRGKDAISIETLGFYLSEAKRAGSSVESLQAIQKRIDQFQHFANENPGRVKVPDTTMTSDWDNL